MRSSPPIFSLVFIFLLINCCRNGEVQADNILFFHLLSTSSHRTSIWPLAEKLADKGHNLTYIFGVQNPKHSHPNIEEIVPSKMQLINQEYAAALDINMKLNNSLSEMYQKAFEKCFEMCGAFYDSPEIQEWMNRPGLHYDLVMMDFTLGECVYGIVHKFQAKHIIFIPADFPFHWDVFGMVPESSTIPPKITFFGIPPKQKEMGFWGRVKSTMEPLIWMLGHADYMHKLKGLIEENMNISRLPDLREFERNTSLVFINTHFIEDYSKALPPMFVSYSGLSCSKETIIKKPLPANLAKFVEKEGLDGFVYVSFGSSVNAALMPIELRHSFFKAFQSFPKLRFLWRWNGEVPEDTPDNVLLQRWFPQLDVLAHPKIKGFITQAGRPSTQEALCPGVPLITIPIFGDQDYNADRLEFIGAAIDLDIVQLDADSLKNAIMQLVYTDKYKKRMSQLSNMLKDRPVDPLENALYWTEYALRHDTSLLKPLGMNQTWYQRRLSTVKYILRFVGGNNLCGLEKKRKLE